MSIVQLLALGGTVLLLRDARMDARLRRRLEALCDSYMIEDPGTVPVLHRFGEGDFDG
jgi:hypothetical protein